MPVAGGSGRRGRMWVSGERGCPRRASSDARATRGGECEIASVPKRVAILQRRSLRSRTTGVLTNAAPLLQFDFPHLHLCNVRRFRLTAKKDISHCFYACLCPESGSSFREACVDAVPAGKPLRAFPETLAESERTASAAILGWSIPPSTAQSRQGGSSIRVPFHGLNKRAIFAFSRASSSRSRLPLSGDMRQFHGPFERAGDASA